MTSLSNRAMLVSLHLRMWNGKRVDLGFTNSILEEKEITKDAGQFNVFLVPQEDLASISKVHGQTRQLFYKHTLAWGENVRILSAESFFEFNTIMEKQRGLIETEHRGFCTRFPDLLKAAPERLKAKYGATTLFRKELFPKPEVIHEKFGMELEILPVPEGGDFRVEVGDAIAAEIRESIERTMVKRGQEAQASLWERVLEAVAHYAKTIGNPKAKFKEATVINVEEIGRLGPKLTLFPDAEFTKICADAVSLATAHDAETLRKGRKIRAAAAAEANLLVKRINTNLERLRAQ